MGNLLMWIGFIFLFFGLPAAIVLTIIAFVKKWRLIFKLLVPITINVIIFFLVFGAILSPATEVATQEPTQIEQQEEKKENNKKTDDKPKKEKEEKTTKKEEPKQEESIKKEEPKQETPKKEEPKKEEPKTETPKKEKPKQEAPKENEKKDEAPKKELTKKEYKKQCKKMYYDEIFFGDENLEGKKIKLDVMISSKKRFTANAMNSSSWVDFMKKYNLESSFMECCVLREGTDSYVGRSIIVYFSKPLGLKAKDYKAGEKLTIYAEVISWSDNTMDGYNSVCIIPKYIEK